MPVPARLCAAFDGSVIGAGVLCQASFISVLYQSGVVGCEEEGWLGLKIL